MPKLENGKVFFTIDDLRPIVKANGIIDCTSGGLILGNSHSDGGIFILRQFNNEELYEVIAEVEGFEYIMHPFATARHKEYLIELNSEFQNVNELEFEEYDILDTIKILDTRPMIKEIKASNKFLLLGDYDQFVINRHTTKKYLKELNELNNRYLN